jgi:lipopolysaccharide export system permease protein
MKTLDKYVAKSFLTGYAISFMVMVGLCITVDLFVNIDEFAEHTDKGVMSVLVNIFAYYGAQSSLYFRDLAGFITVMAAVFSLGKMTKNNELIAVMASGVSLKRVIAPIIFLSVILTGLLIIDQELIIPKLANKLVRSQDYDKSIGESYDFWFLEDAKGNLLCTVYYTERNMTMNNPTIILRQHNKQYDRWDVIGKIKADKAVYNPEAKRWEFENGIKTTLTAARSGTSGFANIPQMSPIEFFETDITPEEIPLRNQESYKGMLSSSQLAALADQESKIKDQAELYSQKHFRITDPIINMIMLMVALPVLVCRDPKSMKPAIMKSFAITGACFVITFACKMVSTEEFLNNIRPELWAWLPVVIFFPIACIELDGMKT